MNKDDGGSAFPVCPPIDSSGAGSAGGYPYPQGGMSLRDYFAAKALHGILAADRSAITLVIVARAYEFADAMLKERTAK